MLISVTAKHINDGKPFNATKCPVALAIIEKYPEKRISVGFTGIFTEYAKQPIPYPIEIRERIMEYDIKGKMEPFNFEWNPPW